LHGYSITSSAWASSIGGISSERPCCLEVDHQLEFGWLLDRQIGGLGALENAACVDTPAL
jgi:hypothetical protein